MGTMRCAAAHTAPPLAPAHASASFPLNQPLALPLQCAPPPLLMLICTRSRAPTYPCRRRLCG